MDESQLHSCPQRHTASLENEPGSEGAREWTEAGPGSVRTQEARC